VPTALLAFGLAAALLVVLPGPDTLVVLRSMVRGGRRRAAWTALGGLTGLVVWVSVTALGLAALLRASHDAYLALKWAGAAYLLWLGVQSLRSRTLGAPPAGGEATPGPPTSARAPTRTFGGLGGFGAGLATNLLNPKIGVLFVAMLPGFVPEGHAVATTSLLLGAIYIAETAAYLAVLIAVAGPVVRWMGQAHVRRRLDRLMGAVFVGFAAQLLAKP
jgi:threonine/homoserine/homoserine lactone efflux protein